MNILVRQIFSGAAQSANGESWTLRTVNSTSQLNDVVYGSSLWVAVGNSGAIAVASESSISQWSVIASGTSENLISVARGANEFVAISNSAAFVSTSGRKWLNLPLPAGINARQVRYVNGIYVVVGTGIATSTDGLTWTSRTNPDSGQLRCVAYGDGKYVAARYDNFIVSDDAITWTLKVATGSSFKQLVNDIIYVPDTSSFFGVCRMGTNYPIKFEYTPLTDVGKFSEFGYANGERFGVSYSDGKFISTGYSIYTQIGTSTSSLEKQRVNASIIRAVKYSADTKRFVAVGDSGQLYTSNR